MKGTEANAIAGMAERMLREKDARVAELEAALRGLVLKSTDHIIAGHPINSDALDALHEAKRVLTNAK